MKDLSEFPRILFYRGNVDFRKRRRGLAAFVEAELQEDPFSKALFVFLNRSRDCIRCLYWDTTGFAMWEKELEKEKFIIPRKRGQEKMELPASQMRWLLEGIDIWKIKPHKHLSFESLLY
jgi:transposase